MSITHSVPRSRLARAHAARVQAMRGREVSGWCVAKALLVVAAGAACWWATIALVVPR